VLLVLKVPLLQVVVVLKVQREPLVLRVLKVLKVVLVMVEMLAQKV
jgi:hypothetical protein